MLKSMEKIFVVIVIVTLALGMVGLNYSYASEASVSVTSAKVNENFIVTVKIPSDAIAYEGKIEVTFSNGSTLSSGNLTSPAGNSYPGNMSATFKAQVGGTANIKVLGLVIKGKNNEQINSKTSLEQSITVEGGQATTSASTSPNNNEAGYTSTGDTVYALEKLNVRQSASTTGEKMGSLAQNASTKRIAVGNNGWDKIEFNGGVGYVMSKYLTTQKPPEHTEKEPKWAETGDKVYSIKSINVRNGWGTSYDVVGGMKVGQEVKRIATGDNGWDKIQYGSDVAYVMSKYLTTSKDEADKLVKEQEEKNEVANEVNNTTTENNTVANNTVENTVADKQIDNDVYNQLVEDIGVIPQVGKSVVDYIYKVAVIIAIALVSFVALKIRENEE